MSDYRADQHFQALLPSYTVLLKDGETTATIYPIYNSSQLPPGLLAFLADEFNVEVERGDTFPFFDPLDFEEFKNYWFGSFAAVMVLGDDPQLDHQKQWEKECLGTFFMRSNFPGRSSHICSGAFLVNAGIRGKGIGRTLAECYLDWAPKLGYTSSVFNLVYESNVGARRIFEALNFKRIGKIKAAGILKDHNQAVDAIIYGKELVSTIDQPQGTYRFDKIRFYLETGKYPPSLDRQEKSRLRSSAAHYKLDNGRLYLKGKEVVGDLAQQLEICAEYHRTSHGGINKTTSAITEKYHWSKIKDTVAQAIRNCPQCKTLSKHTSKKAKVIRELETESKSTSARGNDQGKGNNGNHHNLRDNGSINSNGSGRVHEETDDETAAHKQVVDINSSVQREISSESDIIHDNNVAKATSSSHVIEALVQASSHLERDSDLDYTNLDDPAELLVGVTNFNHHEHQQQLSQQQRQQLLQQQQQEILHNSIKISQPKQHNQKQQEQELHYHSQIHEQQQRQQKEHESISKELHNNQHTTQQHHGQPNDQSTRNKRSYSEIASSVLYQASSHQSTPIDPLLDNNKRQLLEQHNSHAHHLHHHNDHHSDLVTQESLHEHLNDPADHSYEVPNLDETSRFFRDQVDDDESDQTNVNQEVSGFATSHHHGLSLHHTLEGDDITEGDVPAEIEIARALIQANEEDEVGNGGDEERDGTSNDRNIQQQHHHLQGLQNQLHHQQPHEILQHDSDETGDEEVAQLEDTNNDSDGLF